MAAILALIACRPVSAAAAESAHDATWLLGAVRAIVERGMLFDPPAVAALLELEMQDQVMERSLPASACSVAANAWQRQALVKHVARPAWLFDGHSTPEPFLWFSNTTSTACDPVLQFEHRREATLNLAGFPSWACVTKDAIGAAMPATIEERSVFVHNTQEDWSINVLFIFSAASPCASNIDMTQDSAIGWHAQRATRAWHDCLFAAERSICNKLDAAGMTLPRAAALQHNAIVATCGGLTAIYDRAAAGAGPPPPEDASAVGCR